MKLGRIGEVKEQMKRTDIDLLGICETRWDDNGDYTTDDFRVIHNGNENSGRNGVAIIIQGKWKNNILNKKHICCKLCMYIFIIAC